MGIFGEYFLKDTIIRAECLSCYIRQNNLSHSVKRFHITFTEPLFLIRVEKPPKIFCVTSCVRKLHIILCGSFLYEKPAAPILETLNKTIAVRQNIFFCFVLHLRYIYAFDGHDHAYKENNAKTLMKKGGFSCLRFAHANYWCDADVNIKFTQREYEMSFGFFFQFLSALVHFLRVVPFIIPK